MAGIVETKADFNPAELQKQLSLQLQQYTGVKLYLTLKYQFPNQKEEKFIINNKKMCCCTLKSGRACSRYAADTNDMQMCGFHYNREHPTICSVQGCTNQRSIVCSKTSGKDICSKHYDTAAMRGLSAVFDTILTFKPAKEDDTNKKPKTETEEPAPQAQEQTPQDGEEGDSQDEDVNM